MTPPEDPLVAMYLEHMQIDRTPANTVKARMRTLRLVGHPGDATRAEIEAWWVQRSPRSPATRANDLANLRTFYKWAAIWEHRLDDPTARLRAPRVPKGVPRPVTRAELQTLLEQLDGDLRRAVCLGAYAGLRVSEAASLSWPDVDVVRRRARVLGKGSKTRIVALSTTLLAELLPETGGNIVTAGGKPYSGPWLDRQVNRAIAAAGVHATFHQLRHFYGTVGYQGCGGDLVALRDQMGHESIETTAGYAAAADNRADMIADAVAL